MLGRGDRPGHMTLRFLALALAIALAVPASLAILRGARGSRDDGEPPARRRLETLWIVSPVVLLAGLIALAAAA
jgi:hypothetical protein